MRRFPSIDKSHFSPICIAVNHELETALAAAKKNIKTGQFDDAARLLRSILASAPNHGEALEVSVTSSSDRATMHAQPST